ncbi:hypothetical protein BDW69DRAFT_153854 [Aspergillus filifer]
MTGRLQLTDFTTKEEKRQRRRVQNRINQRARRQRLQESAPDSQTKSRRPYRVDRWRLNPEEDEPSPQSTGAPDTVARTQGEDGPEIDTAVEETPVPSTTTRDPWDFLTRVNDVDSFRASESSRGAPLSADHELLHLIHLNVSRGLRHNKEFLLTFALHYLPGFAEDCASTHVHPDVLFYGSTFITTSSSTNGLIPDTLIPTATQTNYAHATWINILPFPRMRENLIRWEDCFDHADFVKDLVGNLVDTTPMSSWRHRRDNSALTLPVMQREKIDFLDKLDDDELTANRNGLIIWGEPYMPESWELTPGFLRKWMWTLEGCEELIESSNRWRRVRGEDPIVF